MGVPAEAYLVAEVSWMNVKIVLSRRNGRPVHQAFVTLDKELAERSVASHARLYGQENVRLVELEWEEPKDTSTPIAKSEPGSGR